MDETYVLHTILVQYLSSSANLQSAVNGLMAAKFRNAGQTCVTANRILIQEDVYDEVLKMFTEQVKKLKVGKSNIVL